MSLLGSHVNTASDIPKRHSLMANLKHLFKIVCLVFERVHVDADGQRDPRRKAEVVKFPVAGITGSRGLLLWVFSLFLSVTHH